MQPQNSIVDLTGDMDDEVPPLLPRRDQGDHHSSTAPSPTKGDLPRIKEEQTVTSARAFAAQEPFFDSDEELGELLAQGAFDEPPPQEGASIDHDFLRLDDEELRNLLDKAQLKMDLATKSQHHTAARRRKKNPSKCVVAVASYPSHTIATSLECQTPPSCPLPPEFVFHDIHHRPRGTVPATVTAKTLIPA